MIHWRFLKRPVWRKVSTWCNIQKYKVKRISKDKIIHCIRVFSTIPRTYVRDLHLVLQDQSLLGLWNATSSTYQIQPCVYPTFQIFKAKNHCCTGLSQLYIFVDVLFSVLQHLALGELRTLFFGVSLIIIISAYLWTEIRNNLSRGEKVRLS